MFHRIEPQGRIDHAQARGVVGIKKAAGSSREGWTDDLSGFDFDRDHFLATARDEVHFGAVLRALEAYFVEQF